ncbi:hypothetical protein GRI75_07195 [Altererythrobacter soli]|uniref:Uncharacterized protein n=1 Tax=Croceibacterium soli TaxID=1739690 RepID=A0A6I4UVE0_9SPHN|nr:hypothetical protein [Croceibacterium soli]MXP41427.1 hypothetical protein [Croceibacterium soli]
MSARVLFCLSLSFTVAACDGSADAPVQGQRIALEDARGKVRAPLASPDTKDAAWTVASNGQAVQFGNPGAPPFLTLSCRIKENPPRIRIIRHTQARPGEKALFPVLGNGTIARFKVDATLADNEWRWEGAVPADDPLLEVFTGAREIEATLPGAGTLAIGGSRIPGEFIGWCRAGGVVREAVVEEQQAEAAEGAAE